jgi:hypothetical protein
LLSFTELGWVGLCLVGLGWDVLGFVGMGWVGLGFAGLGLILIFALLSCPAPSLMSVYVGFLVTSNGPSHFVIYMLFHCSLSSLYRVCFKVTEEK